MADKIQRGRPKAETPKKRRVIGMTDENWSYCLGQPGGASEFLNRLLTNHRTLQDPEAQLMIDAVLQALRTKNQQSE